MASQAFFTLKSCFSFVDDGFLSEFLWSTLFALCRFFLNLFWFIARVIKRGIGDHKPPENGSFFNFSHPPEQQEQEQDDSLDSSNSMDYYSSDTEETEEKQGSIGHPPEQQEQEQDDPLDSSNSMDYSSDTEETEETEEKQGSLILQGPFLESVSTARACDNDADVEEEEEEEEGFNSNFSFSFFGEDFKDLLRISGQTGDSVSPKPDSSPNVLKYQVMSGSHVSGFMEEPETMRFTIQEMFVDSNDDVMLTTNLILDDSDAQSEDLQELQSHSDGDSQGNEVMQELSGPSDVDSLPSVLPKPDFAPQNEIHTHEELDDDISYEVELFEIPCPVIIPQEQASETMDDDYIELMPQQSDENEVLEESFRKNLSENDTKFEDSDDSEDEDEDDEFDILMEHQELVKQMKMEKKNSILKGLPTIEEEEECETPRILEDLKPLKIDADKFDYKDLMLEIHKFYRSYAEKMKKLDILNYQTLQAISFLQIKDSQLFMPSKKTLISSISFTPFKQQRVFADPSLKSINEMHRDLELVYVGQACLTWEILLWQNGKVIELQEHGDSRNLHSYDQVGVEFQQFQVLLQRFLEDERFQGPRVQHFVRSRCLFRGLLQVPCIKDDCPKNKKEATGEEGSRSISITMLAEAIKDSMQTFWEFIHADKDESNGSSTHTINNSPADSQLLQNVKTCLEKKERKIKDIQRSRNCIVKKFQKNKNSIPSSSALLISQVELKLVARVLTMPRLTTDQLTWCLKKLNNISIVNRRVGIGPSFLLFPC